MNSLLVRVGVDQAFGHWNSPVDPVDLDFVYVPIPEAKDREFNPGLATSYSQVRPALESFGKAHGAGRGADLPFGLADRKMHLDPDFDRLTYGDVGIRRGRALCDFSRGDLVVFYAGMRPITPCEHKLLYAIVGFYEVAEIVRAGDVQRDRWRENAHTRRADFPAGRDRSRDARAERPSAPLPPDRRIPESCVPSPARPARGMGWDFGEGRLPPAERRAAQLPGAAPIPRLVPGAEAGAGRGEQPGEWCVGTDGKGEGMTDRVHIVMLRQPGSHEGEARTDPFYEFGCFGLTGCHSNSRRSQR